MMNSEKAIELLNEFASGNLQAADERILQEWIATASRSDMEEVMKKYEEIVMKVDKGQPDRGLFQKIKERIAVEEARENGGAKVLPLNGENGNFAAGKVKRFTWGRIAAAVIVICLVGATAYYFINNNKPQIQIAQTPVHQNASELTPGGNKAILTLDNGRQIILDSAANGTLASQGSIKVIKLDSGQLAYNQSGSSPLGEAGVRPGHSSLVYNTISTPRGGQYQLILADGSKVWLNAASSLRFPTSFTGKERKVELTGEGYFEVVHNAAQPFTVSVNGMEVHDIGTAFNINAYADEPDIRTTLVSGSVKVTSASTSGEAGNQAVTLKPGQQAVIMDKSSDITVKSADIDEAIAWKNGKFQFGEGEDIASVMRQIARWYDVDVEYNGKVTGHIGGSISRNVDASKVFDMLEMTGAVKFKIEGRAGDSGGRGKKVIVMPY